MALKLSRGAAVVAPSFSRLFYRAAINLGLPAILVDDVEGIACGDHLTLDTTTRTVLHTETGAARPIRNLSGISLAILEAGGIVPYTRARIARRQGAP